MGLDIYIHEGTKAFRGAYSAFDRFRKVVVEATGGTWPSDIFSDRMWYFGKGYTNESHPGLHEFLCHSDCDGYISYSMAGKLADEMEALLPEIDKAGSGGGHIERDGGYGEVARKFIAGCRAAKKHRQRLKFR